MGIGTINQPTITGTVAPTPTKRGRGRPVTITSRGAVVRRTKAKKPDRTLCYCVPEPACNAACSRCGHVGQQGDTCCHCGRFYPLKSRPDLCHWLQVQGACGAAVEAHLTVEIIERLDSTRRE